MQNRHHHHIVYKNRKQLYNNYADYNYGPNNHRIINGYYYPNEKALNMRRDMNPYVMATNNFVNLRSHHPSNRIINNNEHFYVNDDMIGIKLREKMINQHKRNLRRNIKRPVIYSNNINNNDCHQSSFKNK